MYMYALTCKIEAKLKSKKYLSRENIKQQEMFVKHYAP